MKKSQKIAIALPLLLILLLSVASRAALTVSAKELTKDNKMTLRVGFFEFDGYHEIKEDGSMSGYGYDFLQMIAPYAGFEYEYIGYDKSWSEMQQMLENGEIDLLTSAHKTPERLEKFDFSDRGIGYSSTMLTALSSNTAYTAGDYTTFNGMRVGMLTNSSRNDSFQNYAAQKEFSYKPVYFNSQEDMQNALRRGGIDAMVTSDLRIINDEMVLDKFDEENFYAIVRKGNTDVLERLNYAIHKLNADSPNWTNILAGKYYSNAARDGSFFLSGREQEYLDSLHRDGACLKVLFKPERPPYSYFENGTPKGIFPDLLETIASRYDIPYEVIETKNLDEYLDLIQKGEPDILFDCTFDYSRAEQERYYLTETYHTAQFCCIKRTNSPDTPKKLAVISGFAGLNKGFDKLYGDCEILEYNNMKECVQAVLDKKADAAYAYVYTALKYVSEDSSDLLTYTPVNGITTDFSIGVNKDSDPALYSIMNRIATNIGEDDIQTSISKNTRFVLNINPVVYFIYHHPMYFAAIIALLIATLLVLVIMKINREKEKAIRQREAKEEHARALEEAYAAANRASQAKSTFLSNVSHDIRTPMNAIIGMTAIAEAHLDDPKQVSDCLSKITISGKHLQSLINEVLDMSKIESGTVTLSLENFNLDELLKDLLDMMTPTAEAKQHELTFHIETLEHANVIGDSVRIQQVLVNILGNAIKYTPNGGKIRLSVAELASDKPEFGTYRFVIEDNGIGIGKEYLDKIFDPFSRETGGAADKIQGTGLGMAISKSIVNMMDGTITVESEQNAGSTFTITIRLKLQENPKANADDKPKKHSDMVSQLKETDYSGKRILVAEDLDINQDIITGILSVTGIDVCIAGNGKIAVDNFAASPLNYYDMILMDIRMPELDGYGATKAIRALEREDAANIPIIAMTANAFAEDVEKAIQSGMNGHLSKPLEIDKLSETLKKWLD